MEIYYRMATVALTMFKETLPSIKRMEGANEIIARLKFIGCLKTGEKINTRHMYVQPDGVATKISRTFFYQDNRNNTLSFVKETINRSFELLVSLERSERESDKVLFINLIKDLHQARKSGLVHLKETYISDTMFRCEMDTILENIDARLKNLGSKYDEIINTSKFDIKVTKYAKKNNNDENDKYV